MNCEQPDHMTCRASVASDGFKTVSAYRKTEMKIVKYSVETGSRQHSASSAQGTALKDLLSLSVALWLLLSLIGQ